ncbi:hypothetical protein [Brevundimonas sp.]
MIAILCAVMLTALVDLVASYHAKLRVIDRVTGEYGVAHRQAIPGG